MAQAFHHEVQVYYEDTDHSGVVYHANYLKYFERAREHMLGVAHLRSLWERDQIGFVVYKASLTFRAGAVFGDTVIVNTTVRAESEYRLNFHHVARRKGDDVTLVESDIELACVDRGKKLVKIPRDVVVRVGA
ncbi:MAG: acyl-CoA thioester hydrolase [Bradymonadia bacterium]|jgi:acyl-CoA thioester hydrolase